MGWETTEYDTSGETCCGHCLSHSLGRELSEPEKEAVRSRALAQFQADSLTDPEYAKDTAELLEKQPDLEGSFEWILELISGDPAEQIRVIRETVG